MSCLINEEILERLYEDFLEILSKDSKLPLEQIEKEAALLAQTCNMNLLQKAPVTYVNVIGMQKKVTGEQRLWKKSYPLNL